jgi:flagellar biogenesis protein FliO
MSWGFWASYLLKLGVVALVLAATYAAAHALRKLRFLAVRSDRRICLLETAMLSPHAAVHLLKVGARYLVVGTAGGTIATLAELTPEEAGAAVAIR